MIRHEVLRNTKFKIKGNSKTIKKIVELLSKANLNERLFHIASEDPNGVLAKKLFNEIRPILSLSGHKIMYGAMETSNSLAKIYEQSRRYGPGSIFLTLSFDDIHNARAIRASARTVNNIFPVYVRGRLHSW